MRIELTTTAAFDCPRTCRTHETRDYCRFNELFAAIGTAPTVNSHTVKIKVDMTDPTYLEYACHMLGWKWLGKGNHQLYDGTYAGHGFTPEGWTYPAVFANGELHADTFNGRWGDDAQIERLKSEYAMSAASIAATALGWQCERTDAGLLIHHPTGGTLAISPTGTCETTGFTGASCHDAREALGLAMDGPISNKPEHGHAVAQVSAGS